MLLRRENNSLYLDLCVSLTVHCYIVSDLFGRQRGGGGRKSLWDDGARPPCPGLGANKARQVAVQGRDYCLPTKPVVVVAAAAAPLLQVRRVPTRGCNWSPRSRDKVT